MATRPKKTESDEITVARDVLAALKPNVAAIAAFYKKLGIKPPIDAKWIAGFETAIDDAAAGRGGQPKRKAVAVKATGAEKALRAKVFAALTSMRDDVVIATEPAEDDTADEAAAKKALRKTFGVGANFHADLTGKLVDFATSLLSALEEPDTQAAAIAAGITSARQTELKDLRDKLSAADTSQHGTLDDSTGGTKAKNAAMKKMNKLAKLGRKVGARVFKGDATIQKKLGIKPKGAKKRAKKPKPTDAPKS